MPYQIRRSDIIEEEGERSLTRLIAGISLLILALILFWMANLSKHGAEANSFRDVYAAPALYLLSIAALIGGIWLCAVAATRTVKTRKQPMVTLNCPFCGGPVQFPNEPTSDWDCEHCHRQVQYENGAQVPIKLITCAFCNTEHKVSAKTTSYLCDRCNRPLKLADANDPKGIVTEQGHDLLRNYDVILTQVGRRGNEVALALESILICNLKEAKQRMEDLPLTVTRNVPERKADAIRRRLRDLGATAVMKPTEDAEQARPGRR